MLYTQRAREDFAKGVSQQTNCLQHRYIVYVLCKTTRPQGGKTHNKMKYLRPRLLEKEIELCLDLFDKQEAKKRILKYIEGVLDDAESQFKNCFTHDVSNSALQENTKLIDNMCISYRHDSGLMDKEQQDKLRFECKEWLRAYENNREHCC